MNKTLHNTPLEAKVAARNRVNSVAKDFDAACGIVLDKLVGKKAVTVNNTPTKAFEAAIRSIELPEDIRGYFLTYTYAYSIYFVVRTSALAKGRSEDTSRAFYAEQSIHLGELQGGVFVKASKGHLDNLRADYTAEEILAVREEVKTARAALQAAETKLAGFEEYDN